MLMFHRQRVQDFELGPVGIGVLFAVEVSIFVTHSVRECLIQHGLNSTLVLAVVHIRAMCTGRVWLDRASHLCMKIISVLEG